MKERGVLALRNKILAHLRRFSSKVDILAIGLLSSIARGDERRGSDIDVFCVVEDESWTQDVEDAVRRELEDRLSLFKRGVSLFMYTISDLKKVVSWHTLSMVRDGIFVYDKGT